MQGSLSKNTITAGNLKDTYRIKGGTNKIIDKGGDANDIQSLMAVYTKDTVNCFVKA